MPTMTLQSTSIPNAPEPLENLEQGTQNTEAPGIPRREQENEVDFGYDPENIKNEPQYSGAMNEDQIREVLRQSGRFRSNAEQLRGTRPGIFSDDFDQLKQRGIGEIGEEDEEKYRIMEPERIEDSDSGKLPFEQERKYREFRE